MNKGWKFGILLGVVIMLLFAANLAIGSVSIPLDALVRILLRQEMDSHPSWHFILWEARLPQALTALLSGSALAVCGLMLQTLFRNPLAGTSILGINSGAGLGVAIVMLWLGGSFTAGSLSLSGFLSVLLGAFVGAMAVMALILFFSTLIKSNVMLLITGMMVGYLASSAVSLLNFSTTAQGVQSYMVWGMGHFGGVSLSQLPAYALVIVAGLLGAFLLIKPLNALLLGERYAENLGVRVRLVRQVLLWVTGLLTAVTTAFCGPVLFLDLAVPHMARMMLGTANHRTLLPLTALTGGAVALFCNLLCALPSRFGLIPLNAITPLIGAPIILYVIVSQRRSGSFH